MQPGQYSYPPQGYGQPQQYQQPQMAPQFQPPAPGVTPAPAAVGEPNFVDPRTGGTLAPKARDLTGRTIIMLPLSVDESSVYQGAPRPSARFDLVVVDGGVIEFGSDLQQGRPNTHRASTPAYFRGVVSGNSGFVQQVRENAGRNALVVGVVERGSKGNMPYLIAPTGRTLDGNDRPDGDARRAEAVRVWGMVQSGQLAPTTPELIAPAGMPAPGSVSYAPAPQYAPQQPQWPAQYQQPQHATAAPQAPVQQAPAQGYPPPPNWDPGMWGNFSPEQQLQILGQQHQQTPPPGGQPTGW